MHKTFWLLPLLVAAFMSSAHADEAQTCDDKTVAAIAAWAGVEGNSRDALEERIAAAACKAMPNAPGTTIAAIAFVTGRVYDDEIYRDQSRTILEVIALIEAGKVVTASSGDNIEDAITRFDSNNYRIDTARYILSKEVRAFGVVFHSAWPGPRCADGLSNNHLTLWIREGKKLRAVFGTELYHWVGNSCDFDQEKWWSESAEMTIAVEKTASHGFADLAITAHVCGDTYDKCLEKPKRIVRSVVKYDGKSYGRMPSDFWLDSLIRKRWDRE